TESPFPDFADGLLHDRDLVERAYANLVNWGGGLANLPSWVRSHRRGHPRGQAKLVLTTPRPRPAFTSYLAGVQKLLHDRREAPRTSTGYARGRFTPVAHAPGSPGCFGTSVPAALTSLLLLLC